MPIFRREPDKGYLDTMLWVPKSQVNVDGLKSALTFTFFEKNAIRVLTLFQEREHHILVPREFWKVSDLPFPVYDCRPTGYEAVNIESKITLDLKNPTKTIQRDAVNAILNSSGGILQLSCGLGKTVVALEVAARMKVPTLIVVDNSQLMEQWKKEIELHLNIPDGVGLIQGATFDWKKPVVLATYQTLSQKAHLITPEIRRYFGLIIPDEAHHISAPLFSRVADMFYGMRLGLTATPVRDDGLHVVCDFHVGRVIYKNLSQELVPKIYFFWTGLSLDMGDKQTLQKVCDKNGELHLSKIGGYFATWKERLDLILNEVLNATSQGRKVLVMSNSVDELVNLLGMWMGATYLYTDIPYPTAQEVGLVSPPIQISTEGHFSEYGKLAKKHKQIQEILKTPGINPVKLENLTHEKNHIEYRFDCHKTWEKCEAEYRKRQREYLKQLLGIPSNAGLMIYKVKPAERSRMLKEKRVVFAIAKYGKEGLDSQDLDTIFACEPMKSKNTLQQFMGRVLRRKPGKKQPIVVFFEDDIGPYIGMCKALRSHLRHWSHEEGGPFQYEMIGHPRNQNRSSPWTQSTV